MKLTAKKLKQLIIEELQEAHMGPYGPKGGPRDPEITSRFDRDVYKRTDPNYKPALGSDDYEHPSDEEAMESHGRAMANAIASIQKQFGLDSFTMKVSGEKAGDIVDAIKKADSSASVEVEKTKGK